MNSNSDTTVGISPEELRRVVKLVRIRIPDGEISAYCKHLSNVAKWFETLSEVDTSGLDPVTHGGTGTVAVTRQDIVNEGNIRTEVLDNASTKEMGFYVVKKVID